MWVIKMSLNFQTSEEYSPIKWVNIYPIEVRLDPCVWNDENNRLQAMLNWCMQSLGTFTDAMPAKGITEGWTRMRDPSDTWTFKKHNNDHFVFVFFDETIKQAFELAWLL